SLCFAPCFQTLDGPSGGFSQLLRPLLAAGCGHFTRELRQQFIAQWFEHQYLLCVGEQLVDPRLRKPVRRTGTLAVLIEIAAEIGYRFELAEVIQELLGVRRLGVFETGTYAGREKLPPRDQVQRPVGKGGDE